VNVVSAQNPFSNQCVDPQGYIPRRTTEDILRALSAHLRDGEPAIVLHGPRGIGKSMLLQVLGERLSGERRVAYVNASSAGEGALTRRILELLGEPPADDPLEALISLARLAADGHRRPLLLIDQAEQTPIACALELVQAAESAFPHLTVIFSACDGHGAGEFISALEAQSRVIPVPFDQVMSQQEALAYVRLRLASGELEGDLRSRLDPKTLAWIVEKTNGLPREVNRRALEVLERFERDEGLLAPPRTESEVASPAPFVEAKPSEVPNATDSGDSPSPANVSSAPRASDPLPTPPAPTAPPPVASSSPPGPPPEPQAASPSPPDPIATPSGPIPTAPVPPAFSPALAPSLGEQSLGGMLLGGRPGPGHDLEVDLDMKVSLGSGLIEPPPAVAPTSPPAEPGDDVTHAESPPTRPAQAPPEAPEARQSDPVEELRETPTAQTRKPIGQHPVVLTLSIGALLCVAAGVGYLAGQAQIPTQSKETLELPTRPPAPEPIPVARPVVPPTPTPTPAPAPAPMTMPVPVAPRPETATPPPNESSVAAPTEVPMAKVAVEASPSVPGLTAPVESPSPASEPPVTASVETPAPAGEPPPTTASPSEIEDSDGEIDGDTPLEETAPETLEPAPSRKAVIIRPKVDPQGDDGPPAYARMKIEIADGYKLWIDGQAVGTAPLSDVFLVPGRHEFVAEKPDGTIVEEMIEVPPDTQVIEFRPTEELTTD